MKFYFFIFCVLGSFIVKAQHLDADEEVDSMQVHLVPKLQFYVAPSYRITQFAETTASFAGAYFGMIYRDQLDISLSYSAILNNFKQQIIYPAYHKYRQTNIGFQAHYSFCHKSIRPLVGLGMQFANSTWEPLSDSDEVFTDYIYIYKVFLGSKWLINNTFAIQITGEYNIAGDVDLIGLETDDLDGFSACVLLKISIGR